MKPIVRLRGIIFQQFMGSHSVLQSEKVYGDNSETLLKDKNKDINKLSTASECGITAKCTSVNYNRSNSAMVQAY